MLSIHRDRDDAWTVRDERGVVQAAGDYLACLRFVVSRLAAERYG